MRLDVQAHWNLWGLGFRVYFSRYWHASLDIGPLYFLLRGPLDPEFL